MEKRPGERDPRAPASQAELFLLCHSGFQTHQLGMSLSTRSPCWAFPRRWPAVPISCLLQQQSRASIKVMGLESPPRSPWAQSHSGLSAGKGRYWTRRPWRHCPPSLLTPKGSGKAGGQSCKQGRWSLPTCSLGLGQPGQESPRFLLLLDLDS